MLLGAEFLAMILVVVYVGAVAVLFLFVVMMLDVTSPSCARASSICAHRRADRGLILVAELIIVLGAWTLRRAAVALARHADPAAGRDPTPRRWANVLYTRYIFSSRWPAWCCWWP
jgi:NADH-quinone oxidoreductase subunit J